MNNRIKITLLWLFLTECMDLHYDYHVSDNFCGIANNIILPDFDLHPATSSILIRLALHILPLLFALGLIISSYRPVRIINFGLAIIYCAFNLAHFFSQFSQQPAIALQICLLGVAALASTAQGFFSFKWLTEE